MKTKTWKIFYTAKDKVSGEFKEYHLLVRSATVDLAIEKILSISPNASILYYMEITP